MRFVVTRLFFLINGVRDPEKHSQERKTFAVNLIAHDFLAEAERPRRADFRRTVQQGGSELSANARSPTGCGVLFLRGAKGASWKRSDSSLSGFRQGAGIRGHDRMARK